MEGCGHNRLASSCFTRVYGVSEQRNRTGSPLRRYVAKYPPASQLARSQSGHTGRGRKALPPCRIMVTQKEHAHAHGKGCFGYSLSHHVPHLHWVRCARRKTATGPGRQPQRSHRLLSLLEHPSDCKFVNPCILGNRPKVGVRQCRVLQPDR